jgi:parallel beta-helix repeat protein
MPQPECPDVGLDPGAGTIHYVCDCGTGADASCQPGDDAGAGDSMAAPWQTMAKAITEFANLAPGDSIALCRGGSFTVDANTGTRWVNGQCLAANPCIVRDYPPPWAAGQVGRPIVSALSGSNGFAFEDGGDADHEEGYTFMNLDIRGSGDGDGFFLYNDIDDVLVCNVSIDNFAIGFHVEGSNPPAVGSDGENERIVLRSSSITNNSAQGWLGACDGCAVEYCSFQNNGFAEAVFNHNIYFSGSSTGPSVGMRAVGNDLYQSAFVGGTCQGVSLVVHGEHDGLLIEGNTVHEDLGAADPGCWGIAMDTGYAEAEGFSHVTIRNNTVVNVGNVGIGLDACDSCVVENNVVIQEQAIDTLGIAVPDRDRGPEDLPMTDVTVRNNSLLFGTAAGGIGIALGGEGTGHLEVSNAIQYLGNGGGWSCFALDQPTASYAAVDHNLCFYPSASGGEWMQGAGALAAWQSSSGLDMGSLASDPAFASVTGPGYDLAPSSASSPLVNAGDSAQSSAADHDGKSRDAQPDIGAYEW